MTLSLLLTLALLGPMTDSGQGKIDTCEEACDKVTDLTAGRWPSKRKGTEEQKQAFEEMRKKVKAQCLKDCESRGDAFIRCVRVARNVERISRCYQRAGK